MCFIRWPQFWIRGLAGRWHLAAGQYLLIVTTFELYPRLLNLFKLADACIQEVYCSVAGLFNCL